MKYLGRRLQSLVDRAVCDYFCVLSMYWPRSTIFVGVPVLVILAQFLQQHDNLSIQRTALTSSESGQPLVQRIGHAQLQVLQTISWLSYI
jgi:hypothetical protein